MAKLETASTTVTFHGEDVRKVIQDNYDVVRAIWHALTTLVDATVKIYVQPRLDDKTPLDWHLTISSPLGFKTVTVTQRRPSGSVSFSD